MRRFFIPMISISLVLLFSLSISSGDANSQSVQTQLTLSITLIGDSYTAGNGAGSYNGESGSYQSSKNWGNRYATWLNTQGVKTTLTNLAFTGRTTGEILRQQTAKVPTNTNLVMLTAGGNDANFADAVKQCFAVGMRDTASCRAQVEHAISTLPAVIAGTEAIFENLESRLSPDTHIVLVGYPLLSTDTSYILEQCLKIDTHTDHCVKYDRYNAAKAVREAGQELNRRQAAFVEQWNATHTLKATFVDTIQSSFAGHEPAPHATNKNPKRWINEFFETEGFTDDLSDTKSVINLDQNNWYHPNITGHNKTALDIINQVGIPSSTKQITSTSGDTDIVFVVDTTGSMGSAINSVKRDAAQIAQSIQSMSRSARFSLVSYQDHPIQGDNPADYPAKTHLDFTSSIDQFTAAINDLELGYGGDWPESVYSGAMAGLNQSWRPGVRKLMIIIGDAPAHDPEPITHYTWQHVAQRAYDIDPVEIYAIDAGYGALSDSTITLLTAQSGGTIIPANGGNIPQAVINSVGSSLAKPFAWIQGPYIIKVGETIELDARGSYAIDGSIVTIEWDLDGDSVFETLSDSLLLSHQFTKEFGGTIGVKITDSNGNSGIGSTRLDVTDDGDTIARSIDNCPAIANQNQADYDDDGVGDDCDDDIGWPSQDKAGVFVTSGEDKKPGTNIVLATDQLSPNAYTSKQQGTQAASISTVLPWKQTSRLPTTKPLTPRPLKNSDKPNGSSSQLVIFVTIGISVVLVLLYIAVMVFSPKRPSSS